MSGRVRSGIVPLALVGACCAIMVPVVFAADPVSCTYTYTDCNHATQVINWTCNSGEYCCKHILLRVTDFSTDPPKTCIVSVAQFCGQSLSGCTTEEWEVPPN